MPKTLEGVIRTFQDEYPHPGNIKGLMQAAKSEAERLHKSMWDDIKKGCMDPDQDYHLMLGVSIPEMEQFLDDLGWPGAYTRKDDVNEPLRWASIEYGALPERRNDLRTHFADAFKLSKHGSSELVYDLIAHIKDVFQRLSYQDFSAAEIILAKKQERLHEVVKLPLSVGTSIGGATVFLSHTQAETVPATFQAMRDFQGQQQGSVLGLFTPSSNERFWTDIFCLRQLRNDFQTEAIKKIIGNIRTTAMVLDPLDGETHPALMKRIFCMFEVHAALTAQQQLQQQQQQLDLRGILTSRGYLSCIPETYSRLDVEQARSLHQDDLRLILGDMRRSQGGIANVNTELKTQFAIEYDRAEHAMVKWMALLLPVFSLVSWAVAVSTAIMSHGAQKDIHNSNMTHALPLGAIADTTNKCDALDWVAFFIQRQLLQNSLGFASALLHWVAETKRRRTDDWATEKWAILELYGQVVGSAVSMPFMAISLLGMALKLLGSKYLCWQHIGHANTTTIDGTPFSSDQCIKLSSVLISGPFWDFITLVLATAVPWCCIFRLIRECQCCCSRSNWKWQLGPLVVIREDCWTMIPFLILKFFLALGIWCQVFGWLCETDRSYSTHILLAMFMAVIALAACGRGARAFLPPPAAPVPPPAAPGPPPAAPGPPPAAPGQHDAAAQTRAVRGLTHGLLDDVV